MGFGWLLVGYFFTAVVSLYSPLAMAMLIGVPMMIVGLRLLAPYHRYLKIIFFSSFLYVPFALYFSLNAFTRVGILPAFMPQSWFSPIEITYSVFYFLFTAALLYAVCALCGEVGLVNLQASALRNLLVMAFTFVFETVCRLPIPFIATFAGYAGLLILLLKLIVTFLNLYLFFNCYRQIAPEGEENEPQPLDDLLGKEGKKRK